MLKRLEQEAPPAHAPSPYLPGLYPPPPPPHLSLLPLPPPHLDLYYQRLMQAAMQQRQLYPAQGLSPPPLDTAQGLPPVKAEQLEASPPSGLLHHPVPLLPPCFRFPPSAAFPPKF